MKGFHRLPDGNPEPPPFREAHAAVRPAITSLYYRGVDAEAVPAGPPPRYDRALLGRFDPNEREPPPVIRYVAPLHFRGHEPPSTDLNPELETISEERRQRTGQEMNVVETVMLPAVPVGMLDVNTPIEDSSTVSIREHARTNSSTGSSETEVALKTPTASAESSPQGKLSKKA